MENKTEIKRKIELALEKLGVKRSIKGFYFLREAILLTFPNPEESFFKLKITKDIYPAVAKKFNTSTSRVERAMRHAVEVSISLVDNSMLELVFPNTYTGDRPTNADYIFTVSQKIDDIVK